MAAFADAEQRTSTGELASTKGFLARSGNNGTSYLLMRKGPANRFSQKRGF